VRGMYAVSHFSRPACIRLFTGRSCARWQTRAVSSAHRLDGSLYHLLCRLMVWAGVNFGRAYSLMLTRSGSRRMLYLMAGATAPALGFLPVSFVWIQSRRPAPIPLLECGNGHQCGGRRAGDRDGVCGGVLRRLMARPGDQKPPVQMDHARTCDRLCTLALMTVVRRGGELLGTPYSAFVPFTVVLQCLLMEHAITFAAPLWERWLFFGRDRNELELLQNMEERLLTQSDLQQFLEAVLAAVRDHLQSPSAFVAALDDETLDAIVVAGNRSHARPGGVTEALEHINGDSAMNFSGEISGCCPCARRRRPDMDRDELPPLLGLLGVARK
jgi:hypothetical protein